MHDPLVVAFQIRRPWPQKFHGALKGRHHWPTLITVWHREPGGHDSGEVCKHYRKVPGQPAKFLNGWRLHIWHWRIQVHPLQHLRRWALTRCAWCGGRSRKGDYVNTSHQWDGPRGRWWRGQPGLFHGDCSSVKRAHRLCLCPVPTLTPGSSYGTCTACGKFHPYAHEPDAADFLLASLPAGSRITPDIQPRIKALWAARRQEREAAK
jgi:hypothetical protein